MDARAVLRPGSGTRKVLHKWQVTGVLLSWGHLSLWLSGSGTSAPKLWAHLFWPKVHSCKLTVTCNSAFPPGLPPASVHLPHVNLNRGHSIYPYPFSLTKCCTFPSYSLSQSVLTHPGRPATSLPDAVWEINLFAPIPWKSPKWCSPPWGHLHPEISYISKAKRAIRLIQQELAITVGSAMFCKILCNFTRQTKRCSLPPSAYRTSGPWVID